MAALAACLDVVFACGWFLNGTGCFRLFSVYAVTLAWSDFLAALAADYFSGASSLKPIMVVKMFVVAAAFSAAVSPRPR